MRTAIFCIAIFLIAGGFASGNITPEGEHVLPRPEITAGNTASWSVLVYMTEEINPRHFVLRSESPDVRMVVGDGKRRSLEEFLLWAKKYFPARRTALFISSRPKMKMVSKGDAPDTAAFDIRTILRALESFGGVDLVGMESCSVSLAEASFALRNYSRLLVGAEGGVIESDWNYDAILRRLDEMPSMTPDQLACVVVDSVCGNEERNLSVLDLSKTGRLEASLRSFSEAAIGFWKDNPGAVKQAAEDVVVAAEAVVVHERHATVHPGASGLDIFFPRKRGSGVSASAIELSGLLNVSGWNDFLEAFDDSLRDSWLAERRAAAQEFGDPNRTDLVHFCRLVILSQESYYSTDLLANQFNGNGTEQDMHLDEGHIVTRLPFTFPFFGETIPAESPIFISANGYIDLSEAGDHSDYGNSTSELAANKRIAPCWTDLLTSGSAQQEEDIYIFSSNEAMIIRWAAETYGDAVPVNVEVVLLPNGRIQFNYGDGNDGISPWNTPPTIGISNGDGAHYVLSHYNEDTTLTAVDSEIYAPIAPTLPDITVIAPDGGEVWRAGSEQTIIWKTEAAVGEVCIDYSVNNGETWVNVIEQTANDGRFDWTIPSSASNQCRVRVKELDGDPVDASDNPFTIDPAPEITLLFPNGGQELAANTTCLVEWNASPAIKNITLEYSATAGETWTIIASSTANDGAHQWTIPDTQSQACLVRVTPADWDPGAGDTSDNYFSIVGNQEPTLWITRPNGREILVFGQTVDITWGSTGSMEAVKLDYTANNGETWNLIAEVTANDGSYTWEVPETPSNACRVRVAGLNNEPLDTSDDSFTIVLPDRITVTAPNGTEQWPIQSSRTITWTSGGDIRDVKIEYSSDNGQSWNAIADTTENDGSFDWVVPGPASEYCLVRITATDRDGDVGDRSDQSFAIVQ